MKYQASPLAATAGITMNFLMPSNNLVVSSPFHFQKLETFHGNRRRGTAVVVAIIDTFSISSFWDGLSCCLYERVDSGTKIASA